MCPSVLYSGEATLLLRVNVSVRVHVKLRSCVSSGYGPLMIEVKRNRRLLLC